MIDILKNEIEKLTSNQLKEVILESYSMLMSDSKYWSARKHEYAIMISGILMTSANKIRNQVLLKSYNLEDTGPVNPELYELLSKFVDFDDLKL